MSAIKDLLALQFRQLEHDKLFHPDILSLPVQRRACHMTLHFAKYSGKLTQARLSNDKGLLLSTLVDSLIICLATANMFNKRISALGDLAKIQDGEDIGAFAKYLPLASQISGEDVFCFAADRLAIEAGEMAKAIESLDHLENYSYVDGILQSLGSIAETVLISLSFLGVDIFSQVTSRLNAVEKNSIFYELHRRNS